MKQIQLSKDGHNIYGTRVNLPCTRAIFYCAMVLLAATTSIFFVTPLWAIPSEQTLTVAEMWALDGLDPAKNGTFVKEKAMITETLVEADADFSLKPGLAEKWWRVDETHWNFTLQGDVYFHNGEPMTAQLVARSLKRALAVNPTVAKLTLIKEVQASDEMTLSIETEEPFPALPAALVNADSGIVYPDSEKNNQGEIIHPLGTGPYQLKEWNRAGQQVLLSSFDSYWREKPHIANILYRSIPDPATRSLEVRKGSVDLVADVPYGDLDLLKDKGFEVTLANTARIYVLSFGSLNGTHFSDQRVRQALSMAVNRKEIVRYVLFGMGKPAAGDFDDAMLFANTALAAHPFAPDKARKLLTDAGYDYADNDNVLKKDGKSLEFTLFTYAQRPGLKPMALAIQQQWQQIGVKVDVRVMDFSAIPMSMQEGDAKLSAMATAMVPDPDYFLRKVYKSDGDNNTWGYFNPEVEGLLEDGNSTDDPAARLELYRKVQAIVYKELPVIPISYYGVNIVTRPQVKGFVFNPVAHDYMLNTSMDIRQ